MISRNKRKECCLISCMYMNNILIVDDEQDIINALKIYLSGEQTCLFEACDGLKALEIIKSEEIHLVLMDIMMPQMDGIEALSKIREFSNVPVILLTAKSEDTDKILGLNVGADDYITKPFNPMEVVARVKSALRRYTLLGADQRISGENNYYSIGNIEVDDRAKVVKRDGEEIALTRKEYDILVLLISNIGKTFSPDEIFREVWKEQPMGSNNVAVHIRHLREKIEINPSAPRYLKVVFGQGYRMEDGR